MRCRNMAASSASRWGLRMRLSGLWLTVSPFRKCMCTRFSGHNE